MGKMALEIRPASDGETEAILRVARSAFGTTEGDEIAALIAALLSDPTAEPRLSVVATDRGVVVGHVLFTAVSLEECPQAIGASILAPLAVDPDFQHRGIGGRLIAEGLALLRRRGVELVFVLGDPGYYRRHGFSPAGAQGYAAPHPIPPEHADAWMVQDLQGGIIERTGGRVACARALADPRYWCA